MMTDEDIDLSELAEVPSEWFRRARIVPGDAALRTQFAVSVSEPVRQWFDDAPQGRDEAVEPALLGYIEHHART